MPNFQTILKDELLLPHTENEVTFWWRSTNENESLIFTQVKEETFFIKEIAKKDKTLVKGDKLTKPKLTKTLQNALKAYEQSIKAKPIYSNIHAKSNRQEKPSPFLKNIEYFATTFNQFQRQWQQTWIEVGFGSGRHLLYQAKENPNVLHVGVEIHRPSIEQVIKQCNLQGINNILIVNFDARVLLEFMDSNSIGRIFVHFPIPWDKKPHRRIISQFFIDEAIRVLEKDGTLELRTDSDNYFAYSLETFLEQKKIDFSIHKNRDIDITSKYEARWKRQEKNIYDIIMTNKEISKIKETPKPLAFENKLPCVDKNIKNETILKENWFVHFEKCYTIDNKKFLYKVAFGDTAFVEHCYIIVKDLDISYFPNNIYATKNNVLAHEAICQRLAL